MGLRGNGAVRACPVDRFLRVPASSSRKMVSVCSVKMSSSVLSLLLFQLLLGLTSGLYFHIGETEKKCFIEEIPDETMIIGK